MRKKTLLPQCILLMIGLFIGQRMHAQERTFKSMNEINLVKMHDTTKANAILNLYITDYIGCLDSLKTGYPSLLKAYDIFIRYGKINGIADASHFLSSYSNVTKNFGKALEYAFLSLKYSELSRNSEKSGRAYRNVGLIYYNQRRWDEALGYFEKSIALIQQKSKNSTISTPLYLAGLCKIELKQYEASVKILTEAQIVARKMKDSLRVHECYWGIGRALIRMGEIEAGKKQLLIADSFYKKVGEFNALSSVHYELARVEFDNNNIFKALVSAEIAQEYDAKTEVHLYQMDITNLLFRIYKKLNQPEKALYFLGLYNDARDSLLNRDLLSEIAVTQAKYEFKKTEDRINEELQQNEIKKRRSNFIVIVFGIFIVLGSVAFYYVRKERKKSDTLLLNILPKSTADELKEFGTALPKSHPAVSIMFCDVESFTKVSEKLSAESIVNMLNYYFGGFDRFMDQFGIEKIKTIGDAYMCVAGLQNEPNHAINIVKAALAFQQFLKDSEEKMNLEFGIILNFRMGINSGSVVSGVVGSKKYAYDIWGDAVNIAARMEQTSIPGKINISGNTYEMIKEAFETSYRGKLSAKNKDAMDMYFVDGIKS